MTPSRRLSRRGTARSKACVPLRVPSSGSPPAGSDQHTAKRPPRLTGQSGRFCVSYRCQATCARLHPDYVSRRFRELAKEAGLLVIKFHAARHTAATLALEAGVDIKIVSEQLGHSTTRITQDLYQHVRHQVHLDSAEKVVELLPGRKGAQETGS